LGEPVLKYKDYYPFGAPMPGRSFNSSEYRFGFNSQEKENEIAGNGNIYSAEYWMYDARLGRRWNVDPVTYPWQSSYAAFNNNPIFFVDPLGREGIQPDPNKDYKLDPQKGIIIKPVEIKSTRIKGFRKLLNRIGRFLGMYKNSIPGGERFTHPDGGGENSVTSRNEDDVTSTSVEGMIEHKVEGLGPRKLDLDVSDFGYTLPKVLEMGKEISEAGEDD
jgi:RHS repeat-associated protein